MQIDVTGHHLEITQALRDYATDKIARLERHFDHLLSAHVVLKTEGRAHQAEATVNVGGGPRLFAQDRNQDLYAAIDSMAYQLDRQVRRHKRKVTDHHRKTAS